MQMKAFGVANTFGAFMVEGTFCYLPKMAYYWIGALAADVGIADRLK